MICQVKIIFSNWSRFRGCGIRHAKCHCSGLPISVAVEAIQALNPHMKYIELKQHGFVLLDVNEQRAQIGFMFRQ
jgi:hypothetical protein